MASCFDSQEFSLKRRPEGLSALDDVEEEEPEIRPQAPNFEASAFAGKDVSEMDVTALKGSSSSSLTEVEEESEVIDIGELVSQDSTVAQPVDDTINPDEQTLHRLLEKGERASHMFRCARIQGLDTIEGLLIFGKEHFYIVDNFTLLRSREIRYIGSLPPGAHEPIIPGSSAPPSQTELVSSKFHYDDIREVHQRRYLLQPIAIEIFASDGRNYLLALPKKHRNKVYQRLMVVCTGLSDNAQQSVEGQRRSASVEQVGGLFSSIIGETSVTHRWVRGEISNFQYLMHLNTLAGRSYNDLMQYPVFPWVLADYESEELDLTNPATFRDLSKPMGAQTPDRLEQFRKRFREWDDPTGETPPYHYGTHYSSAMIVSSYLVRMEPFTQHFLRLQGGHFDLADRMFHSMKEAWNSAARNNMADVKELIPEFFYLPEFFQNSNKFDLGCKQSGTPLDHVVLPSWAKGDPREFIRLHRAALECDFVSSHLHEWIDLIFGFKQRGPCAVDAVNVFHHLFYEGNVDIYSIDDPLKKNATIGFINNFGQIPKQLFKKQHPCKKLGGGQRISIIETGPLAQAPSITPKEKVFYHNLDNLRPSMHPIKEVKGAVGQIIGHDKLVLAVEQNKVLIPSLFQRYLAWGFADHSLRIGSYESDRALLVYEKTHPGEVLAAVCPNNKTIVTSGTSTVVTVYEVVRRQLKQKAALYGHSDAVTCLAACSAYGLLVSGSRDRTAIIWDLASLSFVRQLVPHQAPLAALAINEQTGDIATCAGTWLHLWSINGTPIASVNTALGARSPLQQILCVCFSTMYEWEATNVIVTGSSDGVTRMWSLEYVQVVAVEEGTEVEEDNASLDMSSGTDSAADDMKLKVPLPSGAVLTARRKSSVDSRKLLTANEEFNTGGFLNKCVSESSLSEEEEEGESDPEGSEREEGELDTFVDLKLASSSTKDETATGEQPKSPAIKTPKTPTVDSKENQLSPKEPREKRLLHRQIALASTGSGSSLETSHSLDSPHSPLKFKDSTIHPPSVMRAKSSVETGPSSSEGVPRADLNIPLSKSETNLIESSSDSFVLISEAEVKEAQQGQPGAGPAREQGAVSPNKAKVDVHRNSLLPGMKWVKQLVFRSKLTMHTAYDRQDNAEPASVTALAVSKDHRTVYVGDTRGRVFSWSVCDQPGRGLADHWQRDEGSDLCTACGTKFTVYERKHHCRNCGHLYCSKCSRFESEISRLRILKPVRVCQKCYQQLKGDK